MLSGASTVTLSRLPMASATLVSVSMLLKVLNSGKPARTLVMSMVPAPAPKPAPRLGGAGRRTVSVTRSGGLPGMPTTAVRPVHAVGTDQKGT